MNSTLLSGSDLVTGAKNIRAELKATFPGVKFSVRSSRFSMGDAIDIHWTDGPTSDLVNSIAKKYQDGEFDGMTDCYNYNSGTAREWTSNHGGAKYVHATRSYSDGLVQRVIDALVVKYAADNKPTVEQFNRGDAWNTSPVSGGASRGWNWQELIHRELSATAA